MRGSRVNTNWGYSLESFADHVVTCSKYGIKTRNSFGDELGSCSVYTCIRIVVSMCGGNDRIGAILLKEVDRQEACCESHKCAYKDMGMQTIQRHKLETHKTEMKGVIIILVCYVYSILLFMLAGLLAQTFLSVKSRAFSVFGEHRSSKPIHVKPVDLNSNRRFKQIRSVGER